MCVCSNELRDTLAQRYLGTDISLPLPFPSPLTICLTQRHTGTNAHKKTREHEARQSGAAAAASVAGSTLKSWLVNINRYYRNTFTDNDAQRALDLFHGVLPPPPSPLSLHVSVRSFVLFYVFLTYTHTLRVLGRLHGFLLPPAALQLGLVCVCVCVCVCVSSARTRSPRCPCPKTLLACLTGLSDGFPFACETQEKTRENNKTRRRTLYPKLYRSQTQVFVPPAAWCSTVGVSQLWEMEMEALRVLHQRSAHGSTGRI